jgi:hypothetical protein
MYTWILDFVKEETLSALYLYFRVFDSEQLPFLLVDGFSDDLRLIVETRCNALEP